MEHGPGVNIIEHHRGVLGSGPEKYRGGPRAHGLDMVLLTWYAGRMVFTEIWNDIKDRPDYGDPEWRRAIQILADSEEWEESHDQRWHEFDEWVAEMKEVEEGNNE